MDDDQYDEFGNYIGPDIDDDSDDDVVSPIAKNEVNEQTTVAEEDVRMDVSECAQVVENTEAQSGIDPSTDIVLQEDKKYYPDANEVYPEAEVLVQEEDTQPLEEPLVAPIRLAKLAAKDKMSPELKQTSEFIVSLLQVPTLIRNVAFVGHLHHGKTTLLDLLVEDTHVKPWNPNYNARYCDNRVDEQSRKLSIKVTPASLVLPVLNGKHFMLNAADCPGHVNFADEAIAGIRAADGVIVVVDAVEGVVLNTKRMIKCAVQAKCVVTLCIAKVDRLIHELKLPPNDAYFKLLYVVDQVNAELEECAGAEQAQVVSPDRGNVCFASALNGWCFTLESFASKWLEWNEFDDKMNYKRLARRLWGDAYYDEESRKFKAKPTVSGTPRTFVKFVLEPIYKIYAQTLGEEPDVLEKTLLELGVTLSATELHLDPKPLLKLIFRQFFASKYGIMDMLAAHVPSPAEAAEVKVRDIYTGLQSPESEPFASMTSCNPEGPLMINVVKLFSRDDEPSTFDALGRIYSGTVEVGQSVRVLGETFSPDDDEEQATCTVTRIGVPQCRFKMNVDKAQAGDWVLLGGLDAHINKTATVVDATHPAGADAEIFKPLPFNSESVFKLAIEPLNPSELPKVLSGLRCVNKSYLMMQTKVEESGEHVVCGTGELYLDCIMHDLREVYSDVEVKVSDPVASFCETVVDTSAFKCFADTQNGRNKLTMIAEPLEKGLAEDIERGKVTATTERRQLQDYLMNSYDWDLLAARSIWAFGPDSNGPNVLLDDTLPSEVDKVLLNTAKDSIVQGFRWGCREGPLCDEPIRNVKFKILDASLASEPLYRGGGQVIPTARRVAYSSFLVATPRIMEPVNFVEVQAPADMVSAVYTVLGRRRGHVVKDAPVPGSPFYVVHGYIPVMDSFGFETDLRAHTQGRAFVLQVFDHWSVVPGDPLDSSIVLRPLEPSPVQHLAREFMIKTRRRKGLSEDVSVDKYFDDPTLLELVKRDFAGYSNGI